MGEVALSREADRDLDDIYVYSYRTFGEATADSYLLGLHNRFQSLADMPDIGRAIEERPGLFMFQHARHVVFYRKDSSRVVIVRVLHESMDFLRHLN